MDFYVEEYKGANAGCILAEKARIKSSGIPVVLSAVCVGAAEPEKRLIRDIGVWFQNRVVPIAVHGSENGAGDTEKIFDLIRQTEEYNQWLDLCRDGVFSFVLCVGDTAVICGWNAFVIQRWLGRAVTVSASEHEGDIIRLESGAVILLTDGKGRVQSDRDYAECLIGTDSAESFTRSVREVGDSAGNSSFICVKSA